MTLIQVSPLVDDVQPGSATKCALPCCLLADWGCCAVQLPNGAAGVCGGCGAAGVCGGRIALRGVRRPNGAADTMWARGSVQSYGDACELYFLK